MKHLVDTNIFLEILLDDARSSDCESFIAKHRGSLYISDFSVHSIGVITYRLGKIFLFETFLKDILPFIHIARLAEYSYIDLIETLKETGLDFDDAYQLIIAKEYDLSIATMDNDFKKVGDKHSIVFI